MDTYYILRKGLILGIVMVFIGAGFTPGVCNPVNNIIKKNIEKSEARVQGTTMANTATDNDIDIQKTAIRSVEIKEAKTWDQSTVPAPLPTGDNIQITGWSEGDDIRPAITVDRQNHVFVTWQNDVDVTTSNAGFTYNDINNVFDQEAWWDNGVVISLVGLNRVEYPDTAACEHPTKMLMGAFLGMDTEVAGGWYISDMNYNNWDFYTWNAGAPEPTYAEISDGGWYQDKNYPDVIGPFNMFIYHEIYQSYNIPDCPICFHTGIDAESGIGYFDGQSHEQTAPASDPDMVNLADRFHTVVQYNDPVNGPKIVWKKIVPAEEPDYEYTPYQETIAEGINPAIAAYEEDHVAIVYVNDGTVQCIYSSNDGESWTISTIATGAFPDIYAFGQLFGCTYINNGNLYFVCSADGGATWTLPIQINDVEGTVVAEENSVDIHNGGIIWVDSRGDDYDIYGCFNIMNFPPNQPSNPDPSDHETDVDINTDLSWTGGDPDPGDTVTYDVFFGTTTTPPLVSTGQTETTFDLPTLDSSTTYYWQIIAWDDHDHHSDGPLWSFTTLGFNNQLISGDNPEKDDDHPKVTRNDEGTFVITYEKELSDTRRNIPVAYSVDNGQTWITQYEFDSTEFQEGSGYLQSPDIKYAPAADQFFWTAIDPLASSYNEELAWIPGDIEGTNEVTWYGISGQFAESYTEAALTPVGHWIVALAIDTDNGIIKDPGLAYMWYDGIDILFPMDVDPGWAAGFYYDGQSVLHTAPACKPEMATGNRLYMVMESGEEGNKAISFKATVTDLNPSSPTFLFTSGGGPGGMDKYADIEVWPLIQEYLAVDARDPDISADADMVAVVYFQGGDVKCSASTNGGDDWTVSTVATGAGYPAVYVSSNTMYCAFIRNGNLYLTISSDIGVTWDTPVQINNQEGTVVAEPGSVDMYLGNLVWEDTRGGSHDIYGCFSVENFPPYTPSNPDPSNYETDVDITTDLSWTGGDPDAGDTITYDVYLGTTSPPPKVVSRHPATTYDPGPLDYETTYYWQIVSWDSHDASAAGPIWEFTTMEEPLLFVWVDDDFDETTPGWGYDHFDTIQDGIDAINTGGTVSVYNGMYQELVSILDKQIDLIGENRDETIIDGCGADYAVLIRSQGVTLRNFFIRNTYDRGLWLYNADHNLVENVRVESNQFIGVSLTASNNNRFIDMIISENDYGVWADYCFSLTFEHNQIIHNTKSGIRFGEVTDSIITNNLFEQNREGIFIGDFQASDTHIYHNNFIDNTAIDCGENNWDDGYPNGGNYWSDYTGVDDYHGPNQDLPGSDGKGDTPYLIPGGSNSDHYPFMIQDGWSENHQPFIPADPSPADGATDIDVDADLHWIGGDPDADDTVTYDVYFGVTIPPQKIIDNHTETSVQLPLLPYATTYYWKIIAWDSHQIQTEGPLWTFTTKENDPPYTPSNPDPADGAINVSITTNLSWMGGDPDVHDTVTYDVYLGTTLPLLKVSNNQSETMYEPGILLDTMHYYWQIISWDNSGLSTAGLLWKFDTIIIDTEPPEWQNQGENITSVQQGKNISLFAQGRDDFALDWAFLATNETGEWRNFTGGGTEPWWNSNWNYRKQITINHTQVTGDLFNFPVLISTTSSDFINHAQPDGDDFVFVDDMNTRRYHHEIETYDDATGTLVAWVNMTQLSSTQDTILYVYYGNLLCGNQQASEDTWNAFSQGVWHMKESTTPVNDSTSHHNHGTQQGNPLYQQPGKIGNSISFDGIDDYLSLLSQLTGNTGTLEAWVNVLGGSSYRSILSEGQSTSNAAYFFLAISPSGRAAFNSRATGAGSGNIVIGDTPITPGWHHIVGISNGNSWTLYVDAHEETLTVVSGSNNGEWFDDLAGDTYSIGALDRVSGEIPFNGLLDEIRVSSSQLTAAWITTSYTNQNNPATFAIIGAEEPQIQPGTYGSPMKMQENNEWQWSNFTWQNSLIPNGTRVGWKIYYNDTSDNTICTDILSFYIGYEPNQPPAIPSNPSPTDGAINVNVFTDLSWTGGDPDPGDTVTYDVYFGTISPPPLVSAGQTETTYDLPTLTYSTMYYWQIISQDNHGEQTPGPLWTFTTEQEPGIDPDQSSVTLTNENLPFLVTCPAGDGPTYEHIKVTCKDTSNNPMPGIPSSAFVFTIGNAGDAAWYGTLSCTFTPVDTQTDANGEIRFTIKGDTSIVGNITIQVTVQGVLINDIDTLPCKSSDYFCDGTSALGDFVVFGQDYGRVSWRSDFTGDSFVGLGDFVIFGQHYGHHY